MVDFDTYLKDRRDQFEDDLTQLLKIASVSADSQFQPQIREAANWIAEQLKHVDLATEVLETPGNPIVYAESPPIEGAPTVLVYGHYDVQPPDPLEQWNSPPFEPVIRDGNVYARGATDDKGQMLTHIKSAQAWMESQGRLPLQIKFLIEGEEEVGSEHLDQFLEDNKDKLDCDIAVISDTCQFGPGQPAITYGLKGIAYFEVRLKGPRQDLHSGSFGGAVANPANVLSQLLGRLTDDKGRVQLPGFYDDVTPITERERGQFGALPFDERSFMERIGVSHVHGEDGYTTLERRWARPTCDVNGLWSGYQGEGSKTIIPAMAGAKVSFRLVPDQNPEKVGHLLREWIRGVCPDGIEWELDEMHGAPGVVVSLESPFVTAAAQAIERGFGRSPVFIREGGSIPIVTAFRQILNVDTLLLGWGLDDDNAHSPNEKFSLADYHRGIRASAYLWDELSRVAISEP